MVPRKERVRVWLARVRNRSVHADCVDHSMAFAPGPTLFRHFTEEGSGGRRAVCTVAT